MKLSRTFVLEGKKHFTGFMPGEKGFPPYLEFKLTSLTSDLSDPDLEINGFVDVIHYMWGEKFVRRFIINKSDFVNNTLSVHFSTGDLVQRIRVGLYYNLPVGSLFEKELIDVFPATHPLPYLFLNDPLDFIEHIRTLDSSEIRWLISRGLNTLQAPSGAGYMEDFKKWAICDRIIRLWACGKISANYLDWVVSNHSEVYCLIKNELGICNNDTEE
ncbi:MAG: hypothetical protein JNK50_00960 [Bacteroidia bacterium]|nr:hypothetical protein [Bacteroidia bacterium]